MFLGKVGHRESAKIRKNLHGFYRVRKIEIIPVGYRVRVGMKEYLNGATAPE